MIKYVYKLIHEEDENILAEVYFKNYQDFTEIQRTIHDSFRKLGDYIIPSGRETAPTRIEYMPFMIDGLKIFLTLITSESYKYLEDSEIIYIYKDEVEIVDDSNLDISREFRSDYDALGYINGDKGVIFNIEKFGNEFYFLERLD